MLAPLFKRLEDYVLSAERLHRDDTTVPVLAKGKTDGGRIWVYVGDKPFGGLAPPRGGVLLLAVAPASTPRRIWPAIAVSSRPTPIAAMASFTTRAATQVRSCKPRARSMPDRRSSKWLIWLTRVARLRARSRQ